MLIVLFGLAGVGKTYIGEVLASDFGFYFYDGDADLTEEMKLAIKQKTQFTDNMRKVFFEKLQNKVQTLVKEHKKLVISQAFFAEKYRANFLQHFPDSQFILVEALKEVRYERLNNRSYMPLDPEYVAEMDKYFEEPEINVPRIQNNENGKEEVTRKLERIIM